MKTAKIIDIGNNSQFDLSMKIGQAQRHEGGFLIQLGSNVVDPAFQNVVTKSLEVYFLSWGIVTSLPFDILLNN